MKKSIFLFFAAILCSMSIDAYAATQRYIYVGLSNNYHKWKNESQWGINHWGGTGGGVVSGSKITDLETTFTYSGCTFHMYRMYVYDDNKNFEFKGNDTWWDCKKENISISGTTKNALLFRDNDGGDGGSPTFYQTNYQEESAVSLSASSNSVSVGEEVTLTPKLTSNAEYNEIASTTYSVGTGATVSDGKFVATTAGTYTVTATITYNPKKFTGITKKVENVTCEIVVSEVAVPHPVTGVTVAPTSVTIKQGATATLTATVSPSNADDPSITWSSDNTSVATVVNGVVTAVAAGTANITVTTVDGGFTATCAVKVKPLQYTFYAINSAEWPTVAAHYWGGADGGSTWPGADMVKESETINGFDIYSITISSDFINIMFTNQLNGDDKNKKTEDLTTEGNDGKYYDIKEAKWYASLSEVPVLDPLATDVYLAGAMTDWDTNKKELKKATAEATSASVTVNLTAKTYEFKLIIDGEWKGNDGTMKRGGDAVHEGGWSFDGGNNCNIVADIAGDYTFTWDLNTKKLTVAYPPLPKYTVTATAENGSVTGAGEYEQGSEATLVATPDAGYAFKNWTKGGEEVSTEATYTFTVTANVELVANFVPEETHEVTVSYLCNATPIPGQTTQTLAVGVTTPSTITAPTIKNYKFDSWTLGTGVQSEDATANPIQITTLASGEYTLAANYTKIELTYTVEVPAGTEKCFIRGAFDGWDKFHEMTKVDDTHYTITIEGATTDHKYKYACQASWDYVELKADGSGVDDRTYNANDVVAKWAELAKCYLMGNGDWVNGVEMEYDSKNGQYVLLCHHIYDQFKFKYGNEWTTEVENYEFPGIDWVDDDHDYNYNITLPEGDYNFYFKKDSKKVYIETSTPAHTRTVPVGYYATVCLSQNIIKVVGATLFEVAGKDGNKVIFDEVLTPVAGMPYIFLAEENTISFYCGIETAATPGDHKSLHGTFEDMADAELDGMYMVQNNKIVKCAATGCNIPKNRAYFDGTELDALGVPHAPMPGRRRITMGAEGENTTTGLNNITNGENTTIKVIENGQLIIIRNGEKFNAQGIKL
jgi:hypothetical protein